MFNRVLVQRETIISLKLYNSFNVTKKSSSDAQDRVENIKNFRECPKDVPEHIYLENKPFFTDGQISKLYESCLDKLVSYKFSNSYDDLIIRESFKTLVRQLKKYYHNERGKIENIFRYIKGATVGISEKYKKVQPFMNDNAEPVYSNDSMNRGTSVLQSREMTPKWLKAEEQSKYAPEVIKARFMKELSSKIEDTYKNELPEYLYNDLQVEWLQKEWYWRDEDIEALLEDKKSFLKSQMQFAQKRVEFKQAFKSEGQLTTI